MEETVVIKVLRSILEMLEKLRRKFGLSTIDETIRILIKQYRIQKLSEVFGLDKGRIKPFSEEDRH
ncbi:MAG: VapB-type antitoxin [archaeon YNP-LCB-024-027]|nr:VapB-type antitoxin [Candidatus Culexarchaeum yellowstonense]